MITQLLTKPCTLIQATERADDFDQTPGVPVSVSSLCELQQAKTSEAGEGAVQVSEWRLYLPPATDLAGVDAVMVGGERYELDGDPWPVWNPRVMAVSHVEARVRRTG